VDLDCSEQLQNRRQLAVLKSQLAANPIDFAGDSSMGGAPDHLVLTLVVG
jgi:hypothetical protein